MAQTAEIPHEPYRVTVVPTRPDADVAGRPSYEFADLPDEDVAKIRDLEEKFGAAVVLIAYRRTGHEAHEARP